MKELILKLADLTAPSGTERGIQSVLLEQVQTAADETYLDALGNGIARKKGKGPHILFAAHADETGLMVIHIEKEGFLRVLTVGKVDTYRLIGRQIHFTNGVCGIVGVDSKPKLEEISIDDLYVDIGAANKDEARKRVHIGLQGVISEQVVSIDEHRLAGKALDNRVGCAIAIEAFKQCAQEGYQVSLVFTAQQTVGARGAQTAAFQLEPDLALVIDAAPAGDMPGASRMDLKLGKGPAVKIMDGTIIVPNQVKNFLIEIAGQNKIDIQYEVWPGGLSDAGMIHLSKGGVAVGGISYPARYVGNPSTMIDLRDAQAAVQLLVAAVKGKQ